MSSPVTRELILELIVKAEQQGDTERVKELTETLKNFEYKDPVIHYEEKGNRIRVNLGGPPIEEDFIEPTKPLRKLVKVEK